MPGLTAPKKSGTAPGPGAALRNAFAPGALDFRHRELETDSQWMRIYLIADFPSAVGPGWLSHAANLEGVVLSLHAAPTDPTALTLKLSQSIGLLSGQMAAGGSALSLQRIEHQLADAQALLRQIDAEQQTVFRTVIVAAVTASTEAEGLRRSKRFEGVLAAASMRA